MLVENYFTKEKLRRISATHGGNKVKSVISGDMRLRNDTSHDGRGRAAVMQPLVGKARRALPTI